MGIFNENQNGSMLVQILWWGGGGGCSGLSVKSHYDISFCRLEPRIYILPLYLYFKLRSFLQFSLLVFVLIRDYFDVTAKHID